MTTTTTTIPNDKGAWESHVLVCSGDNLALEKYLLQYQINPNVRFRNSTLLATAIKSGFSETVKLLLRHGANPNLRSSENGRNEPPLISATRWKNIEIVQLLIENGADIKVSGFYGYDALFQAVVENANDILKCFLENIPAQIARHLHQNCPFLAALKYSIRSPNKRQCLLTLIRYKYECECFNDEPNNSACCKVFRCSDPTVQLYVKETLSLAKITRNIIRENLFLQSSRTKRNFVCAINSLKLPKCLKEFLLYNNIKDCLVTSEIIPNEIQNAGFDDISLCNHSYTILL